MDGCTDDGVYVRVQDVAYDGVPVVGLEIFWFAVWLAGVVPSTLRLQGSPTSPGWRLERVGVLGLRAPPPAPTATARRARSIRLPNS